MNKRKIMEHMPTILFSVGVVGIFVSEVMCARDTLKASEIIEAQRFKETCQGEEKPETRVELIKKRVGATWTCFVPTAITTTLTISALIASKKLTNRQIALLSSAVASGASLVTKYREKIKDYASEDILHEIDREVASEEISKAKPPIVTTNGLVSCEKLDLSDDGEYEFFDPFTKIKFKSTKLAVIGAKYYLNRNFALGGAVSLEMFYNFLGIDLPEEYRYAGWDAQNMGDDGYYWIDIDIVRSTEPDPETGVKYYILEYDYIPGDVEDNYYPFGDPLAQEGTHIA